MSSYQVLTKIQRNWNVSKFLVGLCMVQLLWKTVWQFLKNVKHRITVWPKKSTPGYTFKRIKNRKSNRYLYTHVRWSIIHDSHKAETTQMFIERWMDKKNVIIYIQWYIIQPWIQMKLWYMLQKGWILKTLSEISQIQKDKYCMIQLLWNIQNRQIHRERK